MAQGTGQTQKAELLAITECGISDGSHTEGNLDASEILAHLKSAYSDRFDVARNHDASEIFAMAERLFADGGDPLGQWYLHFLSDSNQDLTTYVLFTLALQFWNA